MSQIDPLRTLGTLALTWPAVFDFYHWAAWASHASADLRSKGVQASYTFTEKSKASANPAFWIDVNKNRNLGQIIVWSNGEFDMIIFLDLSEEVHEITDLPKQATDQNFKALFDRFVVEVTND